MKKMILLSSIFAAGALFAGDAAPTPTTVASTEVGVMGLTTPLAGKATLIAVPFLGYTTDAITVADMVNTAELAEGSKLHVPNANGGYDIWTLGSDKKWQPPKMNVAIDKSGANESEGAEANAVQTGRGGAFWLEPASGSSGAFYLLGKPASDVGTSTAVAGKWNLIGNASAEALTTLQNAVTKRDQIAIQIDDGKFRYYTYMGETNGWCCQNPSTGKVETNKTLPVALCQGLWFKPAVTSMINWETGAITEVK